MGSLDKKSLLESLLFAVGRPLAIKEIADFLGLENEATHKLVAELSEQYNRPESGIHIAVSAQKVQMVSNAQNGQALNEYFKTEVSGELSRASLETLTIIAYRQPISREELEQIRGVNCSLIVRNLLIRGLIEAQENAKDLATTYVVTIDFLRHLGLDSVSQLPNYEKLNSNENLAQLLEQAALPENEK